ncbi:DUF779 domain-containing protein [Desertihabitans aurantiacus]|uniref:DUF779 domain-containing protein n=1 Tax=Desertihabitans aurantiacus TaxID=2282477 RepID=UPI0018E55341|nr:DUF779 domain-containing protein [Desertihabitans aurantiacus]
MTTSPAGTPETVMRVAVTPAAAALLRQLVQQHGPLMFHQSGGCCDGSSPMCYPAGTFLTGSADLHLGDLDITDPDAPEASVEVPADGPRPDRVPVWISKEQYRVWGHTHLTIDVVPGRGAGFSVESPTGQRFLLRSRLFTPHERAALG